MLRQLFDASSGTYTYLLWDGVTRQAVIVDPVFEQHARDAALIRELELDLRWTIDTHCHADHVTGAWLMKQAFGAGIGLSPVYGAQHVDRPLAHGDRIELGGRSLEVRATPGHTDGCLTFVTDDRKAALTGDALLIRGAGRTDFQHGDAHQLYRSIREQIFTLPDDCLIYPGHDYEGRTASTVGEEKRHNPRIGGQASEGDFCGYMENLGLAHPKKMDLAVPANLRCGRPEHTTPQASWGPVTVSYAGIPSIQAEWVVRHRDRVHLLDVREPHEHDEEAPALPGSQLIPIGALRERVGEVPRDRPVVAVCRSGARSAMATTILRQAGYTDVANLEGGMLRWRALGLPL